MKTCFYIESTVYPYKNILEEPSNYFSLGMNAYTDGLYLIENNGFFSLLLLLYVERNHFLPYTTLVVNNRLYET